MLISAHYADESEAAMKSDERTVMQTAEFIAEATGLEKSHLRTVSRRLREADLLPQSGRGKGAAAARPQDAALLLLVGALGVPSLHAVRIGEAVLACTNGTVTDSETEDGEVVGDAVDHVAGLIATGEDADLVHVVLHGADLGIIISRGETSHHYEMPARTPARRKLAAKFGQPGRLVRTYRGEFRDGVLPEISGFLGVKTEGAEETAA